MKNANACWLFGEEKLIALFRVGRVQLVAVEARGC